LLLAARKFGGQVVKPIPKADPLQKCDGLLLTLFVIILAQQNHWQLDVLERSHGGQQIKGLKHKANMFET
jgi:hypothetical protein